MNNCRKEKFTGVSNKWHILFPVNTLPKKIKVAGSTFWNSKFCQTQTRQQDDHAFIFIQRYLG